MTTRAFFKVCLVLIFLNAIVEKIYPEPGSVNPETTILYQFQAQKALSKVPKLILNSILINI